MSQPRRPMRNTALLGIACMAWFGSANVAAMSDEELTTIASQRLLGDRTGACLAIAMVEEAPAATGAAPAASSPTVSDAAASAAGAAASAPQASAAQPAAAPGTLTTATAYVCADPKNSARIDDRTAFEIRSEERRVGK